MKPDRLKTYSCIVIVFLIGYAALALSACRTLSTQNVNPASNFSPTADEINGMLYYQPIGKITIKGEFKEVAQDKDEAAKPCATCTPCKNCKPKSGSETPGADDTNAKPEPSVSTPPTKPEESPGTNVSVTQLTITMTPEVEADESSGIYYATPHSNPLYEDEVQVKVNSKHLLTTGKVTTEDKTVEIIGTLASLAHAAAPLARAKAPLPNPFYFSFHPSDSTEVDRVKQALADRKIYFEVTPAPKARQSDSKGWRPSAAKAKQLGEEGLLFRPAIAYKVTLRYPCEEFAPKKTIIYSTQQFVMPDPDRLYEIKYNRMAFVKKVKEAGFTDGMLTDFRQKVPSPILGFLGIPKAIVQAIVPIPATPPSGSGSSSGTTAPQ